MRLIFPGGLNELQTPNIFECGSGQNFELGLNQTKLIPRSPFDLKGTATNASPINGFLQLVKRDNSETTLVQSGDTVYLWNGASVFTSKGSVSASSRLRDVYWSLGDYIIITDIAKATVVKQWDGTTFSTQTTGLGVSLFAKYGVVKDGRVWLANVTTNTDTPHLIVASKFEVPTSYDTSVRGGPEETGGASFATGTEAFYILSPDLKPINGMVLFYDQLVISTEGGRLYRLSGSDASTYKFEEFYAGSAATGTESIANIGNDVIYMRQGGKIDLFSATVESGDVATDDVSRWIPTTTKDLTGAIIAYDQKNQKVFFFVADKVLVLFKYLLTGRASVFQTQAPQLSPWSIYKTAQAFGFNTNAAKYMKMPGSQVFTVYFGDSVGRIFNMNGTGTGDAGSSNISVLRRTRYIYDGEGGDKNGAGALNLMKSILRGLIQYRRVELACDVTISFDWGDEYNVSSSVITLKGAPTAFGGNYWGNTKYWSDASTFWSEGLAFLQKISNQSFSPTGKGPGFFCSVSLDTTTNFQIDSIDLL
jgi:hypothetical protein